MKVFHLLFVLCLATLSLYSHGEPLGEADKQRISNYIEGRYILSGTTIYFVQRVEAKTAEDGAFDLSIDADPLYEFSRKRGADGPDWNAIYYDIGLNPDAKCQAISPQENLRTTDIRLSACSVSFQQ